MTPRLPLFIPLTVAVAALAAPSHASAAGWTCEASALRATVLTAPAIEPLTTNAGAGDCKAGAGSLGAVARWRRRGGGARRPPPPAPAADAAGAQAAPRAGRAGRRRAAPDGPVA